MIIAILLGVILTLSFVPQLWIRYVMRKNSHDLPEIEGTGGELAAHLIERFKLTGIGVEETSENQDHFDPTDKMVRLSPTNFHGKSLKAVAVAAHEVGHAIQFSRREDVFKLREKYIPQAIKLQKLGRYILMASPLIMILFKTPVALTLPIIIVVVLHIISSLTYLIVLPEEWDASFGKAMPILEEGYLPAEHLPAARTVLKAAAFTYFAAALSSILNLGFAILRRRF